MRPLFDRSGTFTVAALGLLTCGLLTGCSVPIGRAEPSIVASGFNSPQGVLVLADGSLLVADSGTGGVNTFTAPGRDGQPLPGTYGETARVVKVAADGAQSVVANLLSVSPPNIDPTGAGHLALLGGAVYIPDAQWNVDYSAARPAQAASLLRLDGTNAGTPPTEVANLYAFEAAANPDGVSAAQGGIESHPYGLAGSPDGQLYVADAAANDLLKVNPASGAVSLVASLAGQIGTAPQSVPTGVAVGSDGSVYVSLLTGYPFPTGGAKVVKIVGNTVSTYADNLTLLTDLQFGPDGQLYALSFGQSDVTLKPPYMPDSGSVIRLKSDGTEETVLEGLNFPSVLAFDTAGDAYVGLNGLGAPGSGQIVKYPKLTSDAGKR